MQINDEIKKITTVITKTIDAEKIYLFGSYAYGTPSDDSDYDFYVVIPDDSLRPIEAMKKIYGALSKTKMNTPVDVLALGLSNFEKRSTMRTLEGKVAREGALLYERNGISM